MKVQNRPEADHNYDYQVVIFRKEPKTHLPLLCLEYPQSGSIFHLYQMSLPFLLLLLLSNSKVPVESSFELVVRIVSIVVNTENASLYLGFTVLRMPRK